MTETTFYIKVNLEHAKWYDEGFDSSKEGDRVTIDYEPTNHVDNNAIICKTLSSEPLGYFPGRAAKVLRCIGDKEWPFQMEGVIVSLEEKENGYRYIPIICKIILKKELESNAATQVIERATNIDRKVVRVSKSQYMNLFKTSMSKAPCSSTPETCHSTTTPSPESPDKVTVVSNPIYHSHQPDFNKALLKKRDSVKMKEVTVENAIHFIHRGQGLPMNRITFLTHKLRDANNNANIHLKFCKSTIPKFLVVDYALTLESVCEELGFDTVHEMGSLLFRRCHFVSPKWVFDHRNVVTTADVLVPLFEDEWPAKYDWLKRDWLKSQKTKKRQREN